MTKPPAMPEPIKTAVSKLKSAQMCNPNAVQHLIEEALAALQSAQPAEVSDGLFVSRRLLEEVASSLEDYHTDAPCSQWDRDRLEELRAILALRPAQQATPEPSRRPLFAASVAARKWAELQEQGHRMQSLQFDGGPGGAGSIDPWGKVMWATPEPVGEPFGWWFTEDPEVFCMPGSGFRRHPDKPQHTVECVPLYTHVAAQPVPMTDAWDWLTEANIDAYLEDYEMRGEDEAGRDGSYTPTEGDRALIKDFVFGLLAEAQEAAHHGITAQGADGGEG